MRRSLFLSVPCNSAKRFKPDPGANGGGVCSWSQPNLQTSPATPMGSNSMAGMGQQFSANGQASLYNRTSNVLSPYYPGSSPGGAGSYMNVSH